MNGAEKGNAERFEGLCKECARRRYWWGAPEVTECVPSWCLNVQLSRSR